MTTNYVHGYSTRESDRLVDQAMTLTELLHGDTVYPPDSRVLEAGCGVGAQTITLVRNSPQTEFVAIDVSAASLGAAEAAVRRLGIAKVAFQQADIFHLPFGDAAFDHVFVCFVLEHLREPVEALRRLQRVVKPGGTITVIEGDHGSAYFHPDSAAARRAIECQVELQRRGGGDALIGRRLFPLLAEAGYREVRVSPRMVYADGARPALQEGFTRKTFTAMVEGVAESAVGQGLLGREVFAAGIRDLHRTAEPDGVFCYTFFKAVGLR